MLKIVSQSFTNFKTKFCTAQSELGGYSVIEFAPKTLQRRGTRIEMLAARNFFPSISSCFRYLSRMQLQAKSPVHINILHAPTTASSRIHRLSSQYASHIERACCIWSVEYDSASLGWFQPRNPLAPPLSQAPPWEAAVIHLPNLS